MNADVLELRLGRILGVGTVVSMLLFAAGLAVLFLGGDRRWSDGLITAGMIILFATPFVRVLVSAVSYSLTREWRFVVMTGTVLLVLIGSVLVAVL
jgi:uncharacterized membrane protein